MKLLDVSTSDYLCLNCDNQAIFIIYLENYPLQIPLCEDCLQDLSEQIPK